MFIKERSTTKRVDDCEESDDAVRECELVLYTKSADFSWFSRLLLFLTFNWNNIYYHQWFLVARFPRDNQLFTFEATENRVGVIEARRSIGVVPANPKTKMVVGTVNTSPKELLTLAQRHPYNGTNAPIWASLKKCQDWLNQFTKSLSPHLLLP